MCDDLFVVPTPYTMGKDLSLSLSFSLSLPFFSHLLHCETLHKVINRNVRGSARQYLEPHSDRLSDQFHHGGGLAGPGRSMDHRDITGGQGVPKWKGGEE